MQEKNKDKLFSVGVLYYKKKQKSEDLPIRYYIIQIEPETLVLKITDI